ncbi:HD domain-containing protein [Candidatus Peregrinibacteria bacterium]|nr:HD domain-containing protein [Candidatus Peregrinibacteria bacterium]
MLFFISQYSLDTLEQPSDSGSYPDEIYQRGINSAHYVRGEIQNRISEEVRKDTLSLCRLIKEMTFEIMDQNMEDSHEDPALNRHLNQVAFLAKEVGEQLGLNETDLKILEAASLIHDVGKRLLNPDYSKLDRKLTDAEYAVVRKHVDLSLILLNGIIPKDIYNVISQHHENYDGTGYPFGIENNHIGLLSRILRAVDAYQAMTSRKHNVGRKKDGIMTSDQALEELERGSGRLFDPQVVSVLKRISSSYESSGNILN